VAAPRSDKSGEPTPIAPVKCAKQIEKFGNNDPVYVEKIINAIQKDVRFEW